MNALKRMTYFLRPYRLMVVLMLVTTVLPVAMELLVPRLLQYVIDDGIRPGNLNAIYWGSALLFGTALLGTIATLGQGVARAQISQGTAFDMRNVLFAHIQSLSYANLDQMQTGQLMTRLSSDVDTVRMFSSAGLALLLRAVLMVSGSMIMLFVTDWELASIMLVLLLIMGVILRALLRRAPNMPPQVHVFNDLELDTGTRQGRRGPYSFDLTIKEYELLELFMRNPRRVLTRDIIYDKVWGYDFGRESNIIEVYVRYLRQKTEQDGMSRLIHTVRGVGYVMRETEDGDFQD